MSNPTELVKMTKKPLTSKDLQTDSKTTSTLLKNSEFTAKANKQSTAAKEEEDEWTAELIKQLNKELGEKTAYNLNTDEAPTNIKRWTSTGSRQLDYIIKNGSGGGFPEGRIIEIQGMSSIGKTHICYEAIKSVQKQGGIAVYIDAENATSIENLRDVGIDTGGRFVFVQQSCIEKIFQTIELTIQKARTLKKDIPIVVVWDSIAASSPMAEIEGDYEQNTIGLAARVYGKGFRKLTNIIGNLNVTLILVNQNRLKVGGIVYGDPTTTPGGLAIPYACSLRIRLLGGSQIKKTINGKEVIIGINVSAKTIKNKVGRPWREVEFEIHFGKGVVEDEQLFNALREHCEKATNPVIAPDGNKVLVSGTAAWKYFQVSDPKTGEVIHDEKFQKSTFKSNILENPKYEMYMKALMDDCFIIKGETNEHKTLASVNLESEVERSAFEQEKEGK